VLHDRFHRSVTFVPTPTQSLPKRRSRVRDPLTLTGAEANVIALSRCINSASPRGRHGVIDWQLALAEECGSGSMPAKFIRMMSCNHVFLVTAHPRFEASNPVGLCTTERLQDHD
jgi:hypothetical protein